MDAHTVELDTEVFVDNMIADLSERGYMDESTISRYRKEFLLMFDIAIQGDGEILIEENLQGWSVLFFIRCLMFVLATMPYKSYLQTTWWQNTRQEALQRAGNRCQICNASKSLNVHHRTYERRGHEKESDLIVLCSECHKLFHDNRRLAKVQG